MFFRKKAEKYMKRIFLTLATAFFLASPSVTLAAVAGDSAQFLQSFAQSDPRVDQLEAFFKSHNSPLTGYADAFIKAADKYELPDWKLVPAITGVESTFGKAIPKNSYNAYGWANGAYAFKSWDESIDHVTKSLKTRYIDRGADTVEKIAPIYAPPSKTWAGKVRFFMREIATFPTKRANQLVFTL